MIQVLVVDGDAQLGPTLVQALTGQGYAVERAHGGSSALDLLRASGFDIVVTDLRMADVDGLTVLREARRHAPEREVLMMTAFTNVGAAIAAMREGASDYIIKPFALDEFVLRIRRLAERCELRARVRALGETKAAVEQPGATPDTLLQPGFSLDRLERDVIKHALARAGGNKTEAARLLGITRRRLYSRLKSIAGE